MRRDSGRCVFLRRRVLNALRPTVILCGLLCGAAAGRAEDRENCLLCHRYPGLSRFDRGTGQVRLFYVDPATMHSQLGPHSRLACSDCHAGEDAADGLTFATKELGYASTVGKTAKMRACRGGERVVVTAGDPAASLLFRKIAGTQECGGAMPPASAGDPLSADEIAKVESWIRAGAKDD